MGQRIVFELQVDPQRQPEAWARIKDYLRAAKAEHLSEPTGNPPHLVTVVLPDAESARQVAEALRRLEGVGRAELDAARWTM